jgi:transcription elongation GreA/GreB family factor
MNKPALVKKIIAQLMKELGIYFRAATNSRAEATHEQNKAESKYDTRGLEASYLARGQSRQFAEVETAIEEFKKLPIRKFGSTDLIDLGAIVEIQQGREQTFYFIGPKAGGTEVVHEKKEVLVITPQSPLGEQLMGRKQGDVLLLNIGGQKNQYKILLVE